MSAVGTDIALRATLLHYAQCDAQIQREKSRKVGDFFPNVQCRKCGLYHASAPCHPYMVRLGLEKAAAGAAAAERHNVEFSGQPAASSPEAPLERRVEPHTEDAK